MDVTEMMVKLAMSGASTWVMWFMVALSIVSIAVVVERYVFFTRFSGDVGAVEAIIRDKLGKESPEAATNAIKSQVGLEARTVEAGLAALDRGPEAMDEIMEGVLKVERLRYEKLLAFLGTVGNNAPFIGLFGTVVEIIRALHELGEKSGVGATAVMGRLSEALAATAVGLIVALPAVAAFNYFQRRLKVMTIGAEGLAHELMGYATAEKTSKGKAAPVDGAAVRA